MDERNSSERRDSGVTLSNQDLRNILTSDVEPTSSSADTLKKRRKTIAVIQSGNEIKGFADPEITLSNTSESSMVTWDNKLEIDPTIIGASIETYLNSKLNTLKEEDDLEEDAFFEPADNTNQNIPLPIQRPTTLPIKITRSSANSSLIKEV